MNMSVRMHARPAYLEALLPNLALCLATRSPPSDDETAKPALSGSMCELVWQGTVQSRCFNAFRFQVRKEEAVCPLGRSARCVRRFCAL